MPQTTGFTVWFTGMLGSGKRTLAEYLTVRLEAIGRRAELLDEDELGSLLLRESGNSREDRVVLARRLGLVAKLVTRCDGVAVVASVSPDRDVRDAIRRDIGRFIEVFCDCPTEKLIERDTTGQYKKALSGQLPSFIGVTEPYQTPSAPEAVVHTDVETVEESATKVFQALVNIGYLKPEEVKAMLGKRLRPRPAAKARRPAKAAIRARPAKRAAAHRTGKARRS